MKIYEVKSTVGTLKIVREALSLNMKEAAQIVKNLPGTLYLGTKVEAIWLAGLLKKMGESPIFERSQ